MPQNIEDHLLLESGGNLGELLQQELLTVDDILLVPREGQLKSRADAKLFPFIYSSPMDTVTGIALTRAMLEEGQAAVLCRFLKKEWKDTLTTPQEKESENRLFYAVGVSQKDIETIEKSVAHIRKHYYPDYKVSINIDVAHGDTTYMHQLYREYRKLSCVHHLMSGAVCTPMGAVRAIEAGCTHLRVGVGPGAACKTRMQVGVGVANLSAIHFIHRELERRKLRSSVHLIADGGIRTAGDAIKYIAAGADGIMLGNLLSTTKESAGWKTRPSRMEMKGGLFKTFYKTPEVTYKHYRGQASADFQRDHYHIEPSCAEGEVGPEIHPDTTVHKVVQEFKWGMRSALSYLGLKSMEELTPENVTFVKVTPATYLEGTPHGT